MVKINICNQAVEQLCGLIQTKDIQKESDAVSNKKLLDKVPRCLSPANVTSTASGLVLQAEEKQVTNKYIREVPKRSFQLHF